MTDFDLEPSEPCIVSCIDLIDIKKSLKENKSETISLMKEVHQRVYGIICFGLPNHEHVYSWNDSVLLLAMINKNRDNRSEIIKEVTEVKQKTSNLSLCYIICVQGMTIPEPFPFGGYVRTGDQSQPRHIYIRASSIAFANCFEIEKELKKNEMVWYIDSRITNGLRFKKPTVTGRVKMLPEMNEREIHMYDSNPISI